MAYITLGGLRYGDASAPFGLLVDVTIKPVIQVTQVPALYSRSLNPVFKIRVIQNEAVIPDAFVFHRFYVEGGAVPAYTPDGPCGNEKEITFTVPGEGRYVMQFYAVVGSSEADPETYRWEVDLTPPTVVTAGVSPVGNDVAVQAPIIVTFSEPMLESSVMSAGGVTFSPDITGVWSSSTGGTIFTFTPGQNLAYQTTYTITITNAVRDLAGNVLVSPYVFTFRTIPPVNRAPNPPHFDGVVTPPFVSGVRPRLVFNVPSDLDADNLHFVVDVSTAENFLTGLRSFNTLSHPGAFTYYPGDGTKQYPFPTLGVPHGVGQVVFLAPEDFGPTKHWLRVIADDRRS